MLNLQIIYLIGLLLSASSSDIESIYSEILGLVSKVRGIEIKVVPKLEVANKDAIEKYVVGQMEMQNAGEQIRLTEIALKTMGCIKEDVNLKEIMMNFARDQVAGYYDWERKVMVVASWVPSIMLRHTLVHELTHALQDQKFDLSRFVNKFKGFSEVELAIHALIEGDATLVMLEAWGDSTLDITGLDLALEIVEKSARLMNILPTPSDLPPVLRDILLFPYVEGLRFVARIRSEGSWKDVDGIYDDPPLSTEQVLHFEKYMGKKRDYPREIVFRVSKKNIAEDAEILGSETIGELGLIAILKQSYPEDIAKKIGYGWDGDRFLVLRINNKDHLLLFVSVWDDEHEAEEALQGFKAMNVPPFLIQRYKDRVLAMWGSKPKYPKKVLSEIINSMVVQEVKHIETYRKMKPPKIGW